MISFKDELNQIEKNHNRRQRNINIIFGFVIVVFICAIYFLSSSDLWN